MKKIFIYIFLLVSILSFSQGRISSYSQQSIINIAPQGYDVDSEAFFTSSGITDGTQKDAIDYLVTELKAEGLWSKFIAIYPMVGGTSSTHKWNLKDPRDLDAAFRINWLGTAATHSVNGVKGSGENDTGSRGDTFIRPSVNMSLNNSSMWYYSTDNYAGNSDGEMGINANDSSQLFLGLNYGGGEGVAAMHNTEDFGSNLLVSNTATFMGVNRISSTEYKTFVDGIVEDTIITTSGFLNSTYNITILAVNGLVRASDRNCAFAAVGEGLTDGQALTFYNIVEQYQIMLGRSNNMPILPSNYPPETDLTTISWGSYSAPSFTPEYKSVYTDNINGWSVRRISDGNTLAFDNLGDVDQIRHTYSKRQPFNSNGAYITLAGSNPFLLDGDSYNVLSRSGMPNQWSNVNPLKAYSFSGTSFYYRILNEGTYTGGSGITIRNFSAYNSIGTHTDEANWSNDDRYWAFYGTRAGTGTDAWIVVYDMDTDTILSETQLATAFSNINWVSVSQDGSKVVIQYNTTGTGTYQGTKSYNKDMTGVVHLVNGTPHGDLGVDTSGNQVFVCYGGVAGYSLSMTNLATGTTIGLWDNNGTSGLYGGHVSCRNILRPGWAYVTESENPSVVDNNNAFLEAFAIKLDGSNTIERYCKTNARQANDFYYHQAQGCPSPDGTKIIFVSDWDDTDLKLDTYAPAWVVYKPSYPTPQSGAYPDSRPYVAPSTYPSYLVPFNEPVNNFKVTRISDATMSGSPIQYQMRHDYSKDQSWNADGSEIALAAYAGECIILDGNDYTYKRKATNIPSRNRWSYTDPDLIYGVTSNRLVSVNATTGAETTIHTFSGYVNIDLGLGEGNQSNDDRYWAVMGKVSGDFTNVDFLVYDKQTNTVLGTLPQGNISGNEVDWISMTQNGEYIVVRYNASGSGVKQGIKRWNKDFTGELHLWDGPQHGDIGIGQNGNPMWVTIGSGVGYYLHMTDMVTGTTTGLVWEEGYGIEGAHVSCRNVDRPGWAYISVEPPVATPDANRMTREMFSVKLDNTNTFERWGFHNASSRVYWQQPHVTPNRDGTKVMFASSWGDATTDAQDYAPTFVIEKE